jgi:signal transduction histidine kinase
MTPARRKTRGARERAALEAVLESIGVETELPPLLSRILAEAGELLGADDGTIGLVDEVGDVVRTAAMYEMPGDEMGFEVPRGAGLTGAVLATRAPVLARRYGDLAGTLRPWRDEHAVIGVPIRWGNAIIGVFGLGRAPAADGSARPFTKRDADTLAGFARYAAVAIENAHRLARERHRLERSTLIARVGQLASANLLLDDLLQRTADAVHELLGYDNVAIPLLVDDGAVLHLMAFGGEYKRLVGGEHRLPITTGIMGAAASSAETVLVNDVASDPRYVPTPGVQGVRAELAVPIILGARVLGVLNVESSTPFDGEDAAGLRVVAAQLAVAIENARLFDASREAAVLDERHRLARELHDAVAQQLFSASLVAQAVGPAFARDPEEGERRAQMLVSLTRTALTEMRALLSELRPLERTSASVPAPTREPHWLARVRNDGLPAALRAYATSPALSGLAVTIADDGYAPQPAAREEALFRIAQEALHNVVKHARATRADVRLAARDGALRLVVRDDGVGFSLDDPAVAADGAMALHPSGLGLRSMRERATELGGTLRIERAPSRGTVVEAALPVQSARAS